MLDQLVLSPPHAARIVLRELAQGVIKLARRQRFGLLRLFRKLRGAIDEICQALRLLPQLFERFLAFRRIVQCL